MDKKYLDKPLKELISLLLKEGMSRKEILIYLIEAEGATKEQAEAIVSREI